MLVSDQNSNHVCIVKTKKKNHSSGLHERLRNDDKLGDFQVIFEYEKSSKTAGLASFIPVYSFLQTVTKPENWSGALKLSKKKNKGLPEPEQKKNYSQSAKKTIY